MLRLFKKKSEKEKLQAQYANLMKQAHQLSTSNRKLSDQKTFEAEEVMKQLEQLNKSVLECPMKRDPIM